MITIISQGIRDLTLVLSSLSKQTKIMSINIIKNNYSNLSKYEAIAKAKGEFQKQALSSEENIHVVHDDDIIHLYDNNLELMYNYLINNNVEAVTLLRNKAIHHICTGVMMIKRKALSIIDFDMFKRSPTCHGVKRSLDTNGYKIVYLDNITRIAHLN